MPNLSNIVKETKALRQVATQIKNAALFYAPKKTGNLKRALNTANRPETMAKFVMSGNKTQFSIQLDVAPPGATYGKWFNDPPKVVSERRKKLKKTAEKKGNWDFGKKALADPSVKREFDRLVSELAPNIAREFMAELKP